MAEEKISFVRWTEIELFHNLFKKVTDYQQSSLSPPIQSDDNDNEISALLVQEIIKRPLVYKGKVKLHGANGGIAIEGSQISAQSRNQLVATNGFEEILLGTNEPYFRLFLDPSNAHGRRKMTIYGEYCGPKVQRGVALEQLQFDIFAIFAIDIGSQLIIEPEDIHHLMTKNGTISLPPNVFILPWQTEEYVLNFYDPEGSGCEAALNEIENLVNEIDKIDPWVKGNFGIEGPGEGLVLFPVSLVENSDVAAGYRAISKDLFRLFGFKAKGRTHRVVGTKRSVQLRPYITLCVDDYVNLMCPEPRFEQGSVEIGGYQITKMKTFLDWVCADVEKEGKDELEASGLEWKDVRPSIIGKASTWYKLKVKGGEQR